ncbi:trypsin-like [Linepithema humile]|uniref:trypsin-like n=1 Tax=Linepithema humile TaxID=83485 RepID=UPI000623AE92|nr:PREDICTED: trypsin-like [Linepithema humile]
MSYRSSMLILFYIYLTMHLRWVFPSVSEEKIIGGTNADITLAPYMLSFCLYGSHACGAAIINEDWAVTAAHCVKAAENLEDITVCSGMSVLYENCVVHEVINFFVHENYNELNNDYDIAVIQVFPPFTFNDCTKAVDLAPDNAQEVSTDCGVACGWGYYMKSNYGIDSAVSQYLQCIKIPLVKKKLCQEIYENRFEMTSQMTCYGLEDGSKDTCKGDSGGPLVNKNNILIGITSWGDGCAKENSPGVYTDVLRLNHWIKDKTGIKRN